MWQQKLAKLTLLHSVGDLPFIDQRVGSTRRSFILKLILKYIAYFTIKYILQWAVWERKGYFKRVWYLCSDLCGLNELGAFLVFQGNFSPQNLDLSLWTCIFLIPALGHWTPAHACLLVPGISALPVGLRQHWCLKGNRQPHAPLWYPLRKYDFFTV